VVEVAGRKVDDLAVLSEALADAAGGTVPLLLERQGERLSVRLLPARAVVTHVHLSRPPGLATRMPPPGGIRP
jgi:hypothetical protein